MKERKISLKMSDRVDTWSALILQFLLYHSLACTGLSAIYEEEQLILYLRMLLLLVPLVYLALVRTYVKTFVLFFVLHAPAVAMVVLLGGNLGEETVVTVAVAIMMIASIHAGTKRKVKEMGCPAMALLVVLLACHFMGYYLQHPLLVKITGYEIQLYIVLQLIHASLSNTSRFIHLHRDTANFPVGQMTIINRLLMILFLVMLVAAMFVFPKLHLEVVLLPILRGLMAVFAWLLSFIKLPEASEQVEQAAEQVRVASLHAFAEGAETSMFWIIVEEIVKFLVTAAVVVLVIGGIAFILYKMYKGFYSERKENADEKEFLVEEMKWFSKDWFTGLKREKEERGTVNQRVRKVYRKYVKKNFKRKESVPEAMTPDELLIFLREKAGGLSEAERCKARAIYEKARYGHPECTADELEEMKRLLTRI